MEAVFTVEGRPPASRAQVPIARFNAIAGDYFRALSVPLLAGRLFSESDYAQGRPLAIVDETMARRIWPGQSPIGRRIKIGWPPERPGDWLEVVGVVADIKRDSLAESPQMEAYLTHTTMTRSSMQLILRARTLSKELVTSVREAVWAEEKDTVFSNEATMGGSGATTHPRRLMDTRLGGGFALIPIILPPSG